MPCQHLVRAGGPVSLDKLTDSLIRVVRFLRYNNAVLIFMLDFFFLPWSMCRLSEIV